MMKVLISLSDSADRFPVRHNEEWYSPVKVNQKPLEAQNKKRGMKVKTKRSKKTDGSEMDLQPTFAMGPGFP
jgi:hypothetical protein